MGAAVPDGAPRSADPPSLTSRQRRRGRARARRPDAVSLRNLLPLEIALALGFFLGVLDALDRLDHHETVLVLLGGAAASAAVGCFSSIGRTRPAERLLVLALRTGMSAAVFALFYEGMRSFMRIGQVDWALPCWAASFILAAMLARLAPVRSRG